MMIFQFAMFVITRGYPSGLSQRPEVLRRTYPERLFYLTGHSLGGGVAKLVALSLGPGPLVKDDERSGMKWALVMVTVEIYF